MEKIKKNINCRKEIFILIIFISILVIPIILYRYIDFMKNCTDGVFVFSCKEDFWNGFNLYITILSSSLILSLIYLLFFSKKIFKIWVKIFPIIFILSTILAFAGANPSSPIGDDTPMMVVAVAILQLFLTILISIFSSIYFKIKNGKNKKLA